MDTLDRLDGLARLDPLDGKRFDTQYSPDNGVIITQIQTGEYIPGPEDFRGEDPEPKPLPIFDADEADRRAKMGMARAEEGRETQAERLYQAVRRVAEQTEYFTSDAVFKTHPELEAIKNHKVMGPVIKRAARDGVCVATGQFIKGDRVVAHGRPLRVWKSLLYGRARS